MFLFLLFTYWPAESSGLFRAFEMWLKRRLSRGPMATRVCCSSLLVLLLLCQLWSFFDVFELLGEIFNWTMNFVAKIKAVHTLFPPSTVLSACSVHGSPLVVGTVTFLFWMRVLLEGVEAPSKCVNHIYATEDGRPCLISEPCTLQLVAPSWLSPRHHPPNLFTKFRISCPGLVSITTSWPWLSPDLHLRTLHASSPAVPGQLRGQLFFLNSENSTPISQEVALPHDITSKTPKKLYNGTQKCACSVLPTKYLTT